MDLVNYDGSGDPWVWLRPEICEQCEKKCFYWSHHKLQHKRLNYEMNQVRLYLHPYDEDEKECPFLTEHVVSQDGSQPQIDDRRPLNDRCRTVEKC